MPDDIPFDPSDPSSPLNPHDIPDAITHSGDLSPEDIAALQLHESQDSEALFSESEEALMAQVEALKAQNKKLQAHQDATSRQIDTLKRRTFDRIETGRNATDPQTLIDAGVLRLMKDSIGRTIVLLPVILNDSPQLGNSFTFRNGPKAGQTQHSLAIGESNLNILGFEHKLPNGILIGLKAWAKVTVQTQDYEATMAYLQSVPGGTKGLDPASRFASISHPSGQGSTPTDNTIGGGIQTIDWTDEDISNTGNFTPSDAVDPSRPAPFSSDSDIL